MYALALRPLLFLFPPDVAHSLAFAALGPVEYVPAIRAIVRAVMVPKLDERLIVRAMGLQFPMPVGLAGGFDKNARRARALAALGFGHLELGTVTAHPQEANPRPNLFRLPADRAIVNRLGFPNDGAQLVAARVRAVRHAVDVPIAVSIGKSRNVPADNLSAVVSDYEASLEAVHGAADFVVVNVSSPNTAGLRTMQAREHAATLLGALSGRGDRAKLLVKIAPDLDEAQLEDLLAVVERVGFAGVVATNTTTSREGLDTPMERVAALGAGGLSGPPLRARALQVVKRVRARLGRKIVVIGVGGVETADDVMAFVKAGADLVQMYTGLIYEGPGVAGTIARDLVRLLEREDAPTIGHLVGAGL
jgi:dihydroorotate dehydrogenase